MLKYCFNSTTLREIGVFDALRLIRDAGYEGVELTLNHTHLHPLNSPASLVKQIREFCQGEGIQIVCVAVGGDGLFAGEPPYHPSLIEPDGQGRARRIDLIKRSVEISDELGAPSLAFNSGHVEPSLTEEYAWDRLRSGVEEVLSIGGNTVLALEPEPDFFLGTTRRAIKLIDQIANPRLQLLIDIGHVNVSEDDCYEAIDEFAPRARHMHIEDIKNRYHHHEIPGEGEIDFRRVFASIHKANFAHYISVELHHHNEMWQRALTASLAYLNRFRDPA